MLTINTGKTLLSNLIVQILFHTVNVNNTVMVLVKPGFVVTKFNCEKYFIGPNTLIFRGRFQKFRF